MTIRLNGSTSGYTEIDAPAVAGSNTLILPGGNGTVDQALVTNGSGTLSFADRGRMVLGTSQASTSGTSIDFTGIPSWVKKITVMFNGVSTSGTSSVEIRLGTSAGIQATGYSTYSFSVTSPSTVAYATSTTGVRAVGGAATDSRIGSIVFTYFGSNTWTSNGITTSTVASATVCNNSLVTLSDTLTQLRITTVNGTDTFDAGSINILYEG